jgi:hypothetical protein
MALIEYDQPHVVQRIVVVAKREVQTLWSADVDPCGGFPVRCIRVIQAAYTNATIYPTEQIAEVALELC